MTSTIVRYLRANHSKHHMGRSYATSRCSCLQIGACCPKTQAFHVDRVIPRAYRFGKFGVPPVKRLRCMVGVLGICLISISPIELRADNPETAYNETETPVNFAPTPSITAVTITNRVAHQFPEGSGWFGIMAERCAPQRQSWERTPQIPASTSSAPYAAKQSAIS